MTTLNDKVREVIDKRPDSTIRFLSEIVALNYKAHAAFEAGKDLVLTRSEIAKVVFLSGKEARRVSPKLFDLFSEAMCSTK